MTLNSRQALAVEQHLPQHGFDQHLTQLHAIEAGLHLGPMAVPVGHTATATHAAFTAAHSAVAVTRGDAVEGCRGVGILPVAADTGLGRAPVHTAPAHAALALHAALGLMATAMPGMPGMPGMPAMIAVIRVVRVIAALTALALHAPLATASMTRVPVMTLVTEVIIVIPVWIHDRCLAGASITCSAVR